MQELVEKYTKQEVRICTIYKTLYKKEKSLWDILEEGIPLGILW